MNYLDNAATTFPKPECVYTAADSFYRSSGANAERGQNPMERQLSLLPQSKASTQPTFRFLHCSETVIKDILGLDKNRPLSDQFLQMIGPMQSAFLSPFFLVSHDTSFVELTDNVIRLEYHKDAGAKIVSLPANRIQITG